jgi:hypothetical protein
MEEFKTLVNSLNSIRQWIASTLECGDAKIRDHCDKARNDMQLVIEQAHAKLDDIHKEFMAEIDAHEKKCQAMFKSIQLNKEDIEKALNDTNELLSKSNLLLKQFKIYQTELSILFESAFSLQNNSETIREHITTRGCYVKKIKNKAECLYDTFITTLFNWSNFFW